MAYHLTVVVFLGTFLEALRGPFRATAIRPLELERRQREPLGIKKKSRPPAFAQHRLSSAFNLGSTSTAPRAASRSGNSTDAHVREKPPHGGAIFFLAACRKGGRPGQGGVNASNPPPPARPLRRPPCVSGRRYAVSIRPRALVQHYIRIARETELEADRSLDPPTRVRSH